MSPPVPLRFSRPLARRYAFRFLQGLFRGLHLAIVVFARHHLLEQAIFGFGDFGFRSFDFVLQGFVGLVRLYLRALLSILAGAFFPLLHVEIVFLAVLDRGKLSGFGFFEACFRASEAGVDLGEFSGEPGEPLTSFVQSQVGVLKLQ